MLHDVRNLKIKSFSLERCVARQTTGISDRNKLSISSVTALGNRNVQTIFERSSRFSLKLSNSSSFWSDVSVLSNE
jgi:hypothetical protein